MGVPDSYTVALLHMDGADASAVFTDESGKAWTAVGNAQIDTAQSVFGGASGLFDGAGDYIWTADHADWFFGTDPFSVDFRVRFAALPGVGQFQMILVQRVSDADRQYLAIYNEAGVYKCQYVADAVGVFFSPLSLAINTWYHIALCREGNNWYYFQDGVQVGGTQVSAMAIDNIASGLVIATYNGTDYCFNGWLDEFRISKGVARWLANFSPPAVAYGSTLGNQIIWMMSRHWTDLYDRLRRGLQLPEWYLRRGHAPGWIAAYKEATRSAYAA